MKNPIGKFRREKLEEINLKVDTFLEEFNLFKERVVLLDSIQNDVSIFKDQVNQIYESLTYEPTPEELKEQEKAAQAQIDEMKLIVRAAISDMLSDPKNQEAIQQFVSQFTGAAAGGAGAQFMGMPYDSFLNKDGEPDWIKAVMTWFSQKGKTSTVSTPSSSSGKPGAY